ncbi:hypothetical protein MJT46_011657, partial [Ovis ammon polii x Ovis aries]
NLISMGMDGLFTITEKNSLVDVKCLSLEPERGSPHRGTAYPEYRFGSSFEKEDGSMGMQPWCRETRGSNLDLDQATVGLLVQGIQSYREDEVISFTQLRDDKSSKPKSGPYKSKPKIDVQFSSVTELDTTEQPICSRNSQMQVLFPAFFSHVPPSFLIIMKPTRKSSDGGGPELQHSS